MTNPETDQTEEQDLLESARQELESFQASAQKAPRGLTGISALQDYVLDGVSAITTHLMDWAEEAEEQMDFLLENQQRQGAALLSIIGAAEARALGTALASAVLGGAPAEQLQGLAEALQRKTAEADAVLAAILQEPPEEVDPGVAAETPEVAVTETETNPTKVA